MHSTHQELKAHKGQDSKSVPRHEVLCKTLPSMSLGSHMPYRKGCCQGNTKFAVSFWRSGPSHVTEVLGTGHLLSPTLLTSVGWRHQNICIFLKPLCMFLDNECRYRATYGLVKLYFETEILLS